MVAGVEVTSAEIGAQLARRRLGYGRGARMKFEADAVTVLSGVRHGLTLGGPIAVEIGIGGSIPFIPTLAEVFPAAQVLVTGVEDPDTRAHSPNESLHLGVFRRAVLSEALFLAALDGRE